MPNRPTDGRSSGGQPGSFQPDKGRLKSIIVDGDAAVLNDYARELGTLFKNKLRVQAAGNKQKDEEELTTSQVRAFLDAVQRLQPKTDEELRRELQLLRVPLAYAAGRHRGRVKQFQEVVDSAIPMTEALGQFRFFKAFIEAIVAYHRLAGGRE